MHRLILMIHNYTINDTIILLSHEVVRRAYIYEALGRGCKQLNTTE